MTRNFMTCSVRSEQSYNLVRETSSDYIKAVVRIADSFSVTCISYNTLKEMSSIIHLMVGEVMPSVCSR